MKTKVCTLCNNRKKINKYCWKIKARKMRNTYCKDCQNIKSRAHYYKNKSDYFKRNDQRREQMQIKVLKYLLAHPCIDCGEKDPVLLEFDHKDRNEKTGNVGKFAASYTWNRIFNEIKKCNVRCCKCHRKKTAKEIGWQAKVDRMLEAIKEELS